MLVWPHPNVDKRSALRMKMCALAKWIIMKSSNIWWFNLENIKNIFAMELRMIKVEFFKRICWIDKGLIRLQKWLLIAFKQQRLDILDLIRKVPLKRYLLRSAHLIMRIENWRIGLQVRIVCFGSITTEKHLTSNNERSLLLHWNHT